MPLQQINRIAYIDLQDQLNTINPDGQNRHLLTHNQLTFSRLSQDSSVNHHSFQFPTWSPNGQYIAVIGGNGRSAALYTISDRPQPHQSKRLYFSNNQLPFYVYWSPDSRAISFIAANATHGIGLHLASLDDEICNLLATGQPLFWDWTPEGDQILMHSGISYPEARLALIDVKHRGVIGENIAQPGLFQAPGVAASGRFWAYAEIDAYDNGQLVVADIVTQEQIEVPYEGAVAFGWNPTGDQLAFIAPPTPMQRYYGPLQLLDTAGKNVRTLVNKTILAFFWSPTGQHIAYLTLADTPNLRGTGKINQPFKGNGNGFYRSTDFAKTSTADRPYRPSETLLLDLWLVNVADGNKEKIATVTPSSLFVNQFLPFFDQYALSHRLWSPDGTALVLPVNRDHSTRIIIIPIDDPQPIAIAEGKIAFWSWQ